MSLKKNKWSVVNPCVCHLPWTSILGTFHFLVFCERRKKENPACMQVRNVRMKEKKGRCPSERIGTSLKARLNQNKMAVKMAGCGLKSSVDDTWKQRPLKKSGDAVRNVFSSCRQAAQDFWCAEKFPRRSSCSGPESLSKVSFSSPWID